jgi:hypothetical protein
MAGSPAVPGAGTGTSGKVGPRPVVDGVDDVGAGAGLNGSVAQPARAAAARQAAAM